MNDFVKQLEESHKHDEDFWNHVYAKAFPNMEWHKACIAKCIGQKLGIDRVIYLKSGNILKLDEKLRYRDYGDVTLEYISNDKKQTPGWVEKNLKVDLIAYGILPKRTCYLMNWRELKLCWLFYKNQWLDQYKHIPANNENKITGEIMYTTWSLAIPLEIIMKKIRYTQKITF